MTDLKLTPRLVAKLLTASYIDSLPSGADKSHIGYKNFADPGDERPHDHPGSGIPRDQR